MEQNATLEENAALEQSLPAVKVAVSQLPLVRSNKRRGNRAYHLSGLPFTRVWLQGYLANVNESRLELRDSPDEGSASVQLDVSALPPAEELRDADYVLVMGMFKRLSSKRACDDGSQGKTAGVIFVTKLKRLSGGSARANLWSQELHFLHTAVYPQIVMSQKA